MAEIKLSKEEKKRLEKIESSFGWRVDVSVKEHFNKAGKLEVFAAAATEDEEREQKAALKGLFSMSEQQATLATLKSRDIFMRVARRVSADAELAALLPEGRFDAKDAEILEKCELKSLAALVRLRL